MYPFYVGLLSVRTMLFKIHTVVCKLYSCLGLCVCLFMHMNAPHHFLKGSLSQFNYLGIDGKQQLTTCVRSIYGLFIGLEYSVSPYAITTIP